MLTEQERDKFNELIVAYGNACFDAGAAEATDSKKYKPLSNACQRAKQELVDYVSGLVVAQIDGITP